MAGLKMGGLASAKSRGKGNGIVNVDKELDVEEDVVSTEDDYAVSTEDDEDSNLNGGEAESLDNEVGMEESGRLRLRPDITLDGKDYAGKKSSRKVSIEQDQLQVDSNVEDLDEKLRAAYAEAVSDDDDEEGGIGSSLVAARDDELDALSREYEKLREEEEKGLEILRAQEKDSQLKGQAVQCQKALWDRALEVRISLQKTLTNANRLPGKEIKSILCHENVKVNEAYASLSDSVVQSLNCLQELETVLIENNTAIMDSYSNVVNANGKREATADLKDEPSLERAWQKLDLLFSKIVPYRDNALDRWQRKTQIYAGAVGKVKLRALNQSVSQQVATTMRDPSRLVSRMRLKKGSVNVLGQTPLAEVTKTAISNTSVEPESLSRSMAEEEGDPETFDDSEFYQQLLREFLESSDPSALGSMSLYASARQHNKQRKHLDRRASKGRKLRYNVFEPLVNFMAPKPRVLPPFADQLFSNLFGSQIIAPTRTS